jgi:branched-chain amino acid transport system permease protein
MGTDNIRNKALGFAGIVVLLVIAAQVLSTYWLSILTLILIFGILAMSLDILMGYTGLPSFGHSAFFGVAAYTVAILSTRYQIGFWGCIGGAILLSTMVAAIFGLLVSHTKGVYFLMITLALSMVIWGLAFRWVDMTSGDNGIAGIPRPDLGEAVSMWDEINFYYFVLGVYIVVFLLIYLFLSSPFGRSLKGIRESESRMKNLGYNTWLHKYLSYVVAGMFSGVSGILWAYYNGFVSPSDVEITASFEAFLMVILGGPGTLVGPALGAGIIIFLQNFLSAYTERWLIIIGAIYILTILYLPHGIMALKFRGFNRDKAKNLSSTTKPEEEGQ